MLLFGQGQFQFVVTKGFMRPEFSMFHSYQEIQFVRLISFTGDSTGRRANFEIRLASANVYTLQDCQPVEALEQFRIEVTAWNPYATFVVEASDQIPLSGSSSNSLPIPRVAQVRVKKYKGKRRFNGTPRKCTALAGT